MEVIRPSGTRGECGGIPELDQATRDLGEDSAIGRKGRAASAIGCRAKLREPAASRDIPDGQDPATTLRCCQALAVGRESSQRISRIITGAELIWG